MRILLWHGYLLTGSGSNLLTANLTRVWRQQGHDVLLLCQERQPERLGFIDAHGDFDPANHRFELRGTGAAPAPGRARLVRPHIGRLLPVYVYDRYEGVVAKRFVDLSDEELTAYTDANVAALIAAIETHRPEAMITGHEVMGPYIALQACRATGAAYLAKLHGSALEYAVKPQQRYRRLAAAGLGGAAVVTGGSRYMLEEASAVVPGWRERGVVVNPGCDVDLFVPRPRPPDRLPVAGFVGKLIAAKGIHHLLCALGLTSVPGLSAVVVGDGPLKASLEALWAALQAGDAPRVRLVTEGASGLDSVARWLASGPIDAAYVERIRKISLRWTGHLDHGPLSEVLPDFDVLVVPSVIPEAFGMVAAEAAACGVLPIVPAHSGIGELGDAVETELGRRGLLTFDPVSPIEGIASTLDRVLWLPAEERAAMGGAVSALARRVWSWERVADELLRLASRRG